MSGKTAKALRKYSKEMNLSRAQYRELKRVINHSPVEIRRMSLALVNSTNEEEG